MTHGLARPAVFSRGSANRLTRHDLGRFEGPSLFAALGRAVCEAGCLPRKEFFEAWEMARRVRRRFRGGRVVDLAGGHGLLAQALLLLDDSSPSALVVDTAPPPSAARLHGSLVAGWPRLRDRVEFVAADSPEQQFLSTGLRIKRPCRANLYDGDGKRPVVFANLQDCPARILWLQRDVILDASLLGKLLCDFLISCRFTGVNNVVAVGPQNFL